MLPLSQLSGIQSGNAVLDIRRKESNYRNAMGNMAAPECSAIQGQTVCTDEVVHDMGGIIVDHAIMVPKHFRVKLRRGLHIV